MKSLYLLLLAAVLFSGCAGTRHTPAANAEKQPATAEAPSVPTLDDQLQELTNQIVQSLSQQKKSKIAVIEFMNLQGETTDFGKYLAEELITRLFRTGKFEVIERQLLNKVLDEHKLNLSGIVDETSARELGKILGVDAIASGSVTDLGESMKINARLIATESGKIFSVASVSVLKDGTVQSLTGEPAISRSVPSGTDTAAATESPVADTTAESADGENAVPPAWTIEEQGFKIVLDGCSYANRKVTCRLEITNTTVDDKEFNITCGWDYETKIFDDQGNEYGLSGVTYGSQYQEIKCLSQYGGATKKIIAGATVKTKVYFKNVSPAAERIALLQILSGGKGGMRLEFRDIPLVK